MRTIKQIAAELSSGVVPGTSLPNVTPLLVIGCAAAIIHAIECCEARLRTIEALAQRNTKP